MMKGIAILVCLLLAGCASPQPTRVALPTGHTVQRGESLALIAQRYYGEENRSEGIKAIMRANPQIGRGPGIQTKLVLTIPKLKED